MLILLSISTSVLTLATRVSPLIIVGAPWLCSIDRQHTVRESGSRSGHTVRVPPPRILPPQVDLR